MCTWQSITNVLDGYYLAFFFVIFFALIVMGTLQFDATWEVEKREQRPGWRERAYKRAFDEQSDEGPPSDQELRTTRYARFVPARRAAIIGFVAMFAYPVLSPTFCQNLNCGKPFFSLFQPDPACDLAR